MTRPRELRKPVVGGLENGQSSVYEAARRLEVKPWGESFWLKDRL